MTSINTGVAVGSVGVLIALSAGIFSDYQHRQRLDELEQRIEALEAHAELLDERVGNLLTETEDLAATLNTFLTQHKPATRVPRRKRAYVNEMYAVETNHARL